VRKVELKWQKGN